MITADIAALRQITRASPSRPYLSFVYEFDPAVIAELSLAMRAVPVTAPPLRIAPTNSEILDAVLQKASRSSPANMPASSACRAR